MHIDGQEERHLVTAMSFAPAAVRECLRRRADAAIAAEPSQPPAAKAACTSIIRTARSAQAADTRSPVYSPSAAPILVNAPGVGARSSASTRTPGLCSIAPLAAASSSRRPCSGNGSNGGKPTGAPAKDRRAPIRSDNPLPIYSVHAAQS